jgi:PTH1 family peptidyl-tRNA hydrolase
MHLIVGLGNPGTKYANTRHNAGFILLNEFASKKGWQWKEEKKFNAEISGDNETLLAKPLTFMNNSGEAVSKILSYYKIPTGSLTVVNDEVDLPFGTVRVQTGASSAGHRGVQNIIDQLGTKDFRRIRIGVGRSPDGKIQTPDWVLMDFSKEDIEELKRLGDTIPFIA